MGPRYDRIPSSKGGVHSGKLAIKLEGDLGPAEVLKIVVVDLLDQIGDRGPYSLSLCLCPLSSVPCRASSMRAVGPGIGLVIRPGMRRLP